MGKERKMEKIKKVIYENGVQLFFRGTFLGQPVYSKAIEIKVGTVGTIVNNNLDKTRR